MLVAQSAVNAVFVTWATVLDARHTSALARALGATPGQVGAGLAATQIIPALAGAPSSVCRGARALCGGIEPDAAPSPRCGGLLATVAGAVVVVTAF